jgi:hypothetical protein
LKHSIKLSRWALAASLALVFIPACSKGKQSGEPSAPNTAQPTVQPSPLAGASSTSFQKWNPPQVVAAFKAAGLEIENPTLLAKPKDAGLPVTYTDATSFAIPSAGGSDAGRIYSFASESDLEKMVDYYAQASADAFSWVYVRDNILVRLNGELAEEKAKQYEAALSNMK